MRRLPVLAAALAAFVAAVAPQPAAQAADVAVGVYRGEETICGHRSVLGNIRNNFRHQVTHVPHLPNVGIVDLYGARPTRHEPSTINSPIERLYCSGIVRLTSGEDRPIWYLVEYGQGFAGLGDNVEFCILGFDRWNVYDGACRVLR